MIDDPYARRFLADPGFRLLTSTRASAWVTRTLFDRRYPGYMAIVLLRHRWFEAELAKALSAGVEQIVLLGAGFDSTALRLDVGNATVYEVDAAPTQRVKREIIEREGLAPAAETRYVECDFERDSLRARLRECGFDTTARSLVAWWGVSFFLTEDAVRATITDVASVTAPGSVFTFDYLDASVVDGTTRFPGALRARTAVAKRGEPYRFGLRHDAADDFTRPFGFTTEYNLAITELAAHVAPTFPYRTDDFFGVMTLRRNAT